jgi:hypothetical protein
VTGGRPGVARRTIRRCGRFVRDWPVVCTWSSGMAAIFIPYAMIGGPVRRVLIVAVGVTVGALAYVIFTVRARRT